MTIRDRRLPGVLLLCGCTLASAEGMLGSLKAKAGDAAAKIGEGAGIAAEAVGKAAGRAVDVAKETAVSTHEDLRDEESPAQTRAKIDAMAEAALERLFAEVPGSRDLFDASAGYAVFDTRQVQYGVAAGYGRGVAIDREDDVRTYMRMGSGGVGVGLGFGGFDTTIVILFESAFGLNRFVTDGLDASAEAGAMAGDDKERLALRFDDGRAVFALTNKGWKISARLAGTRYWPDQGLNGG
jgi:hypothetical protein